MICFESISYEEITEQTLTAEHINKHWLPELRREWMLRKTVRRGRSNFNADDIQIEKIGVFFGKLLHSTVDIEIDVVKFNWIPVIVDELEMKRKFYPRWLKTGKISKEDAVRAYRVFTELLYFFLAICENGQVAQ